MTSTGWPGVRELCAQKLGVHFDPWQDGAGRLILAKRSDGKLACTIGGVGMSVPRQVGKTYLIAGMTFALCVLRPGMLVIWSAHHAKTHGETFLSMQAFAERLRVAPFIEQVFVGSGDEEIRFRNGSRILFGARERGFGRGIPGVDMIVSDEAQIMTDKALDAQLATMNTSRFGLAIFLGTPPRPDDPSEAFTRMRDDAWAGELEDSVWVEFGAEHDADIDDRKQWAKANPSYPRRTPTESMLRLRRKLTPDSFKREALGIWNENTAGRTLIDIAEWDLLDTDAAPDGSIAYGVKFSPDGATIAVSVAVRPVDGPIHIEGVHHRSTIEGTRWLVDWLSGRWRKSTAIVVDGQAGAAGLVKELRLAGVLERRIIKVSTEQAIAANSMALSAIADGTISHLADQALDNAVRSAGRRPIGKSGGWGLQSIDGGDVTLLESAFLAHYGAATSRRAGAKPKVVVMA